MFLQLDGIGKQKISYKDPSTIKFDDLAEYILLAKKSISKFANRFYNGLASKMLKDEEAISNVANAIMMADWRFDENYKNDANTKKTKYSYRNQCALWAIQTYVTKNHKKQKRQKNKIYSLNYSDQDDENSAYSYVEDARSPDPLSIIIEQENKDNLSSLIDQLLSLDCLTDKQKNYIRLYYFEDYTFEEIGQKYNLTREAIRQSMNKALSLIKTFAENIQ